MGDAHVVIVDDDGVHVGRRAVGPQNDEIVEVGVGKGDATLDAVLDDSLARYRRLDADDRWLALRRISRVGVAPPPGIARELAFGARLGAHFVQFLRRLIGAVGTTRGDQLLRDLPVPLGAGELENRLAVPAKAEPGQAVEDGRDRRIG